MLGERGKIKSINQFRLSINSKISNLTLALQSLSSNAQDSRSHFPTELYLKVAEMSPVSLVYIGILKLHSTNTVLMLVWRLYCIAGLE